MRLARLVGRLRNRIDVIVRLGPRPAQSENPGKSGCAAPRVVPMQGVQPAAKNMPIRLEAARPFRPAPCHCGRVSMASQEIFKTPRFPRLTISMACRKPFTWIRRDNCAACTSGLYPPPSLTTRSMNYWLKNKDFCCQPSRLILRWLVLSSTARV